MDIWNKRPKGTRIVLEEEYDEWLSGLKADYDELKADAEIVRRTKNYKGFKEHRQNDTDPNEPYLICHKELWEEILAKSKTYDKLEVIARFECFKLPIDEIMIIPIKHYDELNHRMNEAERELSRIKSVVYNAPGHKTTWGRDLTTRRFMKKLHKAAGMENYS